VASLKGSIMKNPLNTATSLVCDSEKNTDNTY